MEEPEFEPFNQINVRCGIALGVILAIANHWISSFTLGMGAGVASMTLIGIFILLAFLEASEICKIVFGAVAILVMAMFTLAILTLPQQAIQFTLEAPQ